MVGPHDIKQWFRNLLSWLKQIKNRFSLICFYIADKVISSIVCKVNSITYLLRTVYRASRKIIVAFDILPNIIWRGLSS